jgi:oxalate decarboxylase/phosphoglucose isomerase-like protein (cupin superfamily)
VTLGDKVQEAHAGSIVFIPKGTWIGLENIGKGQLTSTGVLSAPGYEEYLRAISVPEGKPIVPLSKAELDEIRERHSHDAIYQ